jgi:hypothetical protein
MCVGGFALPSSVFCAGEELRYLFLQRKATTRCDLTLKSRALSSLQLTLPTRMIPSLTLICVSRHVLHNISSLFFFFCKDLHCDEFVLEFFFFTLG